MKRVFIGVVVAAVIGACVTFYKNHCKENEVVIISTNDMHSSIGDFAKFAQAVKQCRDTVATVVVDAGDRWTGNAFVDLAEGRRPILDLMNYVGYDAATLGNHEFDCGGKFLAEALRYGKFKVLCANIQVADSLNFPRIASCTTMVVGGVRLMLSGVVTNYDYGHPDGKTESFAGMTFSDPQQAAIDAAQKCGNRGCGKKRAVKILLSHMGDERDMELASKNDGYDLIVSGHTHKIVDTLVGRTVIGQTKNKMAYIGVTRITTRGRYHVKSIEYENIKLDSYAQDAHVARMVDSIRHNPLLTAAVGTLPAELNKVGLANMETSLVARAANAQIGFYHYGGIRLATLPAGEVSLATLYDLEPFGSGIYTMRMTTEQMQRMIIDKFNDKQNVGESHRIDLFCTTPYTIYTDASGDAVRVEFLHLEKGKTYKVAMCDYIATKYRYEAQDVQAEPLLVLDVIANNLRSPEPKVFDNTPKQFIKPEVRR